ncbi:MAG: cadmium-translocating P-type ATPase, partial [Clostridia bacterium]|nr:cadmium-translocating P-type ATPase [Clostridia bacterium]
GERVPLDGVVVEGDSMLDTAALTGESLPRRVGEGDSIYSGCINCEGSLRVKVTKTYEDSTVSKILELVENASSKKASTENFITRFAKYYTPIVTVSALLLALIPPLFFGGDWSEWVGRACVFLVISCPCALVISVPMGFFGGIGAASRIGVLVKGSNYFEVLADVSIMVFDKTGTLTKGGFTLSELVVHGIEPDELLELASYAENYSNHPIANSIKQAYGKQLLLSRIGDTEEIAGLGIHTYIDGDEVLSGNAKLMERFGVEYTVYDGVGSVVYVARNRIFCGAVVVSDKLKDGVQDAILQIKDCKVKKCVMLSGDSEKVASGVSEKLGLDAYRAELLPADKMSEVEKLLGELEKKEKLAFVGDGINDAPVLTRADVGIAMGSMGSDAAIEAADIVIMDDNISKIPQTLKIARRTLAIVKQNIVFALGVKVVVLALGLLGFSNMWEAVFADVGVSVIAILNSMRALKVNKLK